jgi:hypothetical protein
LSQVKAKAAKVATDAHGCLPSSNPPARGDKDNRIVVTTKVGQIQVGVDISLMPAPQAEGRIFHWQGTLSKPCHIVAELKRHSINIDSTDLEASLLSPSATNGTPQRHDHHEKRIDHVRDHRRAVERAHPQPGVSNFRQGRGSFAKPISRSRRVVASELAANCEARDEAGGQWIYDCGKGDRDGGGRPQAVAARRR